MQVVPVVIPLYTQAPGSKLDYSFDWNDGDQPFLVNGDTIASATWSAVQLSGAARPGDVALTNPVSLGSVTTTFVQGSRIGQTWRITCRVTTNAGRIDSRSIDIVFATT